MRFHPLKKNENKGFFKSLYGMNQEKDTFFFYRIVGKLSWLCWIKKKIIQFFS